MPHSDFWPFDGKTIAEDVATSGEASLLQKQLGDMEGEVKEIQMELEAIKRDRLDLHGRNQKNVLTTEKVKDFKVYPEGLFPEQLSKNPEVAKLQEDLIRAKNAADEENFQRQKYEAKLKDLENKLNSIRSIETTLDTKEYRKFTEEEVNTMKTQIRDLKEEMEEMRTTVVEKTEESQEYRIKYLQAQQQAEELRRQLDLIEYDNKQVSDQIQIEIQKIKIQFQEKLQELAPLPDLLKGAQIQLQEAKQMQRLAEDSSLQFSNELHHIKEKLVIAVNNLNQEKAERTKLLDENRILITTVNEKQKEITELTKTLDESKCRVLRLEEKLLQEENRYREKSTETMQLLKDIEDLRVESSRSLNKCKDRSDSMRRYMQTQISEMERQLIQSRAQCRSCQKERDEIRQRMQIQINNLQENFELVEIRLRALQNQVTSLKSTYTVILADEDDVCELSKVTTSSSID